MSISERVSRKWIPMRHICKTLVKMVMSWHSNMFRGNLSTWTWQQTSSELLTSAPSSGVQTSPYQTLSQQESKWATRGSIGLMKRDWLSWWILLSKNGQGSFLLRATDLEGFAGVALWCMCCRTTTASNFSGVDQEGFQMPWWQPLSGPYLVRNASKSQPSSVASTLHDTRLLVFTACWCTLALQPGEFAFQNKTQYIHKYGCGWQFSRLAKKLENARKSENLAKGLLHIPEWLVFSPPLKFHLGMLKAT